MSKEREEKCCIFCRNALNRNKCTNINCPCHSPKEEVQETVDYCEGPFSCATANGIKKMCRKHYPPNGDISSIPQATESEVQESMKVSYETATPAQKYQIGMEVACEANEEQRKFMDTNKPSHSVGIAEGDTNKQESSEGDSWEEEFDKLTGLEMVGNARTYHCPADYEAIKGFIMTKKAEWEKDSYEKGQDDAFRGRIENMSSIVVKETFEVPGHLREYFKKEARTLALQEAASAVRGMRKENDWNPENEPDIYQATVGGYNQALEDAAREIEGLSDKK